MKKFLSSFLIALVLLTGTSKFALAEEASVNLTLKNNGDVVYSGVILLSPTPSEDNVLSVIKQADILSPDFNISDIVHYSFGDYLRCINVSGNDLCDNWLYKVNGDSPMVGMDSYALSGSENIVLYFGDENKTSVPEPEPTPEPETPPAHSGGGSSIGGYLISNTVCEQGQKFSVTNGRLCTSFTPASSPVASIPASTFSNTNLEEKPLEHSSTGEPKPVLSSTPKKQTKQINKVANQNTATVINSVDPSPAPIKTETPKKNWFMRLLGSIFGF
jgi:hypothetical protein